MDNERIRQKMIDLVYKENPGYLPDEAEARVDRCLSDIALYNNACVLVMQEDLQEDGR